MANLHLPIDQEVTADVPGIKVTNKGTGDGLAGKGKGGGSGVSGSSKNGDGVIGRSESGNKSGVWGDNTGGGSGVSGSSINGNGVVGWSEHGNKSGVWGDNTGGGWGVAGSSANGAGIYGRGRLAAFFEGNVEVTGDVRLTNADCAEEFDISEDNVTAGTVVVLNEQSSLQPCNMEYDRKVAGIISGAVGYRPAIILDRKKTVENQEMVARHRLPLALVGKVYCKVDARKSSIEIGDLLTTSDTKGHAMKVEDPAKAFGAVIGKALGSIKEGLGLIPVLVTLQ